MRFRKRSHRHTRDGLDDSSPKTKLSIPEHGSIATVKSHRPLRFEGNAMSCAAWLIGDVTEYGNNIFGERQWRLIEMRFTREPVAEEKETVIYLSVTARMEPL